MTHPPYPHRLVYRLRLGSDADHRAPGGAVTVALCGHWDHEGPCRWPHFSSIVEDGEGAHRLLVEFDAPEDEVEIVRARIDGGLRRGRLTGPDGRVSVWEIVG